jgi:hypothetical protein
MVRDLFRAGRTYTAEDIRFGFRVIGDRLLGEMLMACEAAYQDRRRGGSEYVESGPDEGDVSSEGKGKGKAKE